MSKENQNVPWNKGELLGQKRPLKLEEIWGIRIRLELAGQTRDLAMFNLAIDSKLRGCDFLSYPRDSYPRCSCASWLA